MSLSTTGREFQGVSTGREFPPVAPGPTTKGGPITQHRMVAPCPSMLGCGMVVAFHQNLLEWFLCKYTALLSCTMLNAQFFTCRTKGKHLSKASQAKQKVNMYTYVLWVPTVFSCMCVYWCMNSLVLFPLSFVLVKKVYAKVHFK